MGVNLPHPLSIQDLNPWASAPRIPVKTLAGVRF